MHLFILSIYALKTHTHILTLFFPLSGFSPVGDMGDPCEEFPMGRAWLPGGAFGSVIMSGWGPRARGPNNTWQTPARALYQPNVEKS